MPGYNLTFKQCEQLKQRFANMNHKEMSYWIEKIFQEGYKACQMEPGSEVDFELIKKSILDTRGIGPVLYGRICESIANLYLEKGGE